MRRPILGLLLVAVLGLAVSAVPAASAMFDPFPRLEGTPLVLLNHDSLDGLPQPGTTVFMPYRGPIATRPTPDGMVLLPGARGPGEDAIRYYPRLDGNQRLFRSELAALSFNAMLTAATLATPPDPQNISIDSFDSSLPFRPDGCSFRRPTLCSTVAIYYPADDTRDVPDGEAAIPEPGAAVLFGAGFALVGVRVRLLAERNASKRLAICQSLVSPVR